MRYKVNDEKVFADVTDGIAILIEMESGMYYGMNLFTTAVFENIIGGADTEELLSALTKVKGYDEDIRSKCTEFIRELTEKEFIAENPAATATVMLSFDEFPKEELDFVLSSFPDAYELLLADPIHQVKEEEGWKPNKGVLK